MLFSLAHVVILTAFYKCIVSYGYVDKTSVLKPWITCGYKMSSCQSPHSKTKTKRTALDVMSLISGGVTVHYLPHII